MFVAGPTLTFRENRLTEHLHEQKAQLAILSSSQSVIDTFSPDALTARLTRIQERQVKMDQKADIILQILVDQTQPVVSKAEQEWLSELEELHGVVKRRIGQTVAQVCLVLLHCDASNFPHSIAAPQLKAQKELLAQKCLKLGTTQSNLVKTKVLGSSQIERIRRSLDVEFELIANVTRRTELLVQAMQRINLP